MAPEQSPPSSKGLGLPRRRRVRYEQCGVVDEQTGPHHQEDPPAPTSDSAETSVGKTPKPSCRGRIRGSQPGRLSGHQGETSPDGRRSCSHHCVDAFLWKLSGHI
ncbi:unnamed protein product [Pleuronectes platessa]|uniref:Uncharacterized protein n=1 Tax=Pleuronectes platessa TaxID=8262 RepID=A0A9N7YEC8_PLEPL|nr:unnamed protein product [Pleuronectes platessa]